MRKICLEICFSLFHRCLTWIRVTTQNLLKAKSQEQKTLRHLGYMHRFRLRELVVICPCDLVISRIDISPDLLRLLLRTLPIPIISRLWTYVLVDFHNMAILHAAGSWSLRGEYFLDGLRLLCISTGHFASLSVKTFIHYHGHHSQRSSRVSTSCNGRHAE
jgi:hypothetical protein